MKEKHLLKNKAGFTLAELLIVVAIIAVLVSISIPIYTVQIEKSKESTDFTNMESAKAAAVAAYYKSTDTDAWKSQNRFYYDVVNGKIIESNGSNLPVAYGKGTSKEGYEASSKNYYDPCGDKNYSPETDYTDKIIVAYVSGSTMHVHWTDGKDAGSYTPSEDDDDDDEDEDKKDDDDKKPTKKDDDDDDDDGGDDPSPTDKDNNSDWPSMDDVKKLSDNEHYEVNLTTGGVYVVDGITYISVNSGTYGMNRYRWGTPSGTETGDCGMWSEWFLKIDGTNQQIPASTEERFSNVTSGAIYTASDGTQYIYHGSGDPYTWADNPEIKESDAWIKISTTPVTKWTIQPGALGGD